MWQTSRLTIHNLLYESKVKIHDYNICCTYQFPCLNTAAAAGVAAAGTAAAVAAAGTAAAVAAAVAAAAAAAAAAVGGTDSVAGDQQFALWPPVG